MEVLVVCVLLGFFLFAAYVLPFLSNRRCPDCNKRLTSQAKACGGCGWTSRAVDPNKALSICIFSLNEAFNRKLIDSEALERGKQVVEKLRESLRNATPNPNPNSASDVSPPLASVIAPETLVSSIPSRQPLTPTLVDTSSPAPIPPVLIHSNVAQPNLSEQVSCRIEESVKDPSVSPPVITAHALDRDYHDGEPNANRAKPMQPVRTWSKWLSAFMEEKNIQWGELIGGLMIVCCSAALVLSFWQHIASRPWLKFSIFTGINAAILGLGLNAWYRWKLPTTSHGILMIGMMLVPLNFLAFAIFTLGMGWDSWTISGELLSLFFLSVLTWFASQVVTPRTVVFTTLTASGFALSNLLVRRFVTMETSGLGLYLAAGGLISFYVTPMLLGWREHLKSTTKEFDSALRLLALGTFGFTLAFGLLVACSGKGWQTIHLLSPLASVIAFPVLFYGLNIQATLRKGSRWWLPSILMAAGAISIGILSLLFAWPTPVWLLLSLIGLSGLLFLVANHTKHSSIASSLYFIASCAVVLLFHIASGHVRYNQEDWRVVWNALVSPDSGFALIGCSTAILIGSIALNRSNRFALGLVSLRSAWFIGIAGLAIIGVFGLGRHEYATSVSAIYFLYATALIVVAAYRRPTYHDIVAGVFILIASLQAIRFGWMMEQGWLASSFWSMIVATFAFVAAGSLRGYLMPTGTNRDRILGVWMQVAATIASALCCLWLIASELESIRQRMRPESQLFSYPDGIVLAVAWGAIGWVLMRPSFWTLAQSIAAMSGAMAIYEYSKQQSWFSEVHFGLLHPYSVQLEMMWIACFASVVILVRAWLDRQSDSSGQWILTRLNGVHQSILATPALLTLGVATVLLCAYGAAPGSLQELVPRDFSSQSQTVSFELNGVAQTREIPAIQQFSIPSFPHAAFTWSGEGVANRIAGIPRVVILWIVVLASSALLLATQPSSLRWGLFLSVLISIVFPIASIWESDVAVASALRWELSICFLVGCVALRQWHTGSPMVWASATRETEPLKKVIQFDRLFQLLIFQVLVPLFVGACIVMVGSLSRRQPTGFDWAVWTVVGGIGMVGLLIMFLRLPIPTRNGETNRSTQTLTLATLMSFPFVAWLVLQVVLALVNHPLTGPNANSLFMRMGLAPSYAIPMLLFSIGLLVAAASRPSPFLSFVSCLVLQCSSLAAYMLTLKSNALKPAAWIGLVAMLCILGGIYVLCWQWYARRQASRNEDTELAPSQLALDRAYWQQCLQQIAIGFLVMGIAGGIVLALANGSAIHQLGLASIGLTMAGLVTFLVAKTGNVQVNECWWILAIGGLVAIYSASMLSDIKLSVAAASVALLFTAFALVWRTNRENRQSPLRWCFDSANVSAGLFAFRELFEINGSGLSIGLLSMTSIAAMAMAWRSGIAVYVVRSMLLAHTAGFVFCWHHIPTANLVDLALSTLLTQIAISAFICIVSSLVGFGTKVRPFLRFAIGMLTCLSFGWYALALVSEIGVFRIEFYLVAILLCFVASSVGYWYRHCTDADLLTYLSTLCGVICFIQVLAPSSTQLLWSSTLLFAAFCLASSFVWRASDRIRDSVNRLNVFPKLPFAPTESSNQSFDQPTDPMRTRPASTAVVVANTMMALLVSGLGWSAQFLSDSQPIRLATSQAILAVAIAVGFLARYKDFRVDVSGVRDSTKRDSNGTTALRTISLLLGAMAGIAFGWHFFDTYRISWIDHLASAGLSLAVVGTLYGFGLVKWFGMKQAWQEAALQCMPGLLATASGCVLFCLVADSASMFGQLSIKTGSSVSLVCTILTILISMALCLAAALLPGRDPLGLSERSRTAYVYAAEILLLGLVVHVRVRLPWLFSGWLQSVWPIVIVGLSFLGLGASEWAKRRRIGVLVEPLYRTGAILPLLPALAHWMLPSGVHYSISLWCAAAAYGSFGYLRKSMLYWALCLLFANAGLWYLLHESEFSFATHPQLWVIPPAMCVLALVQILRDRMQRRQVAAARYLATSSIYVASTTELFMRGIAEAPWMPMVLAVLSIAGILFGIGARIRAMLWLGTMFLCVALFSIVWHAAVDLQQTWVWYVTGIVLGIIILTMFALFEKRRENLQKLVSTMQKWDD